MRISEALSALLPNVQWTLQDDDLQTLKIHTPGVTAPSKETVDAYIAAFSYKEKRAAEYPPIGDQLDAIWKGGQAAADMLAQVQAVKEKYPKP